MCFFVYGSVTVLSKKNASEICRNQRNYSHLGTQSELSLQTKIEAAKFRAGWTKFRPKVSPLNWGTQRQFSPKCFEKSFYTIQSILRSLEMYSKWR